MKKKYSFIRMLGVCALSLGLSTSGMYACNSSSGGGDDPDPPVGTPVTLSGQITANSSDLALSSPLSATQFRNHSRQSIASGVNADVAPAPGMEITVTQVNSDGTTEELAATATSDVSGNYTLTLDAVTQTTAGQSDFYYLITATDGTVVLNSVAAPTEDMTTPVSPGTTFGAAALNNGIGGISTIPSAEQVNNLNLLNDQILTDLPEGTIQYPSNANTPEALEGVLAMANGAAISNSQSQFAYVGVLSESNFYSIVTDATAGVEEFIPYAKKVILNSCAQYQPLTDLDASVMAQALEGGVTYTPTQIVAAMNAASNDPDVSVDTAVSSFVTLLTNVEAISPTTGLEETDLLALNVKRNLTAASFTSETALQADQVVAFIENLNFGSGPQAGPCAGNINITNVLQQLTEASELASPAIAQVQVYGESTQGCPGQATVTGEVEVYIPEGSGVTVSNAELSGGALASPITGKLQGLNRYTFDDPSACAVFGVDATYTITVNLSSGGPLTRTVDRNHPEVQHPTVTVDGVPTSNDGTQPSDYSVPLPLFTWDSPADVLASITDAPPNSAIKYTYEFAYIDGSSMSPSPLNTCPQVSSGALYSVNNMLPSTQCDPEACSALSGVDANDIVCRLNIQTILVDEADNYLETAAGEFAAYRYVPAP